MEPSSRRWSSWVKQQPRHVTRHDQNNFNVIRLLLALLVLVSHAFPLTRGTNDTEPLAWLTGGTVGLSFGDVAVDGFFIISGYLITTSWRRSRSAGDYILKRVFRIYPGYLVAFTFSALVAITTAEWRGGYVQQWWTHNDEVLRNLLFLDYGALDSPWVFGQNPFPRAVNGSLWTLQPELLCYVVVLLLGLLGLLSRRRVLPICAAACYAGLAMNVVSGNHSPSLMWRFLLYFLLGAVVTESAAWRTASASKIVAALALLVVGAFMPPLFTLVFPIAATYLTFVLALAPWRPGAAWCARTDLSYGVYLYAFPVEQLLVKYLSLRSPVALIALAAPPTLALATASWFLIEQPAQRFNRRRDSALATASPPLREAAR